MIFEKLIRLALEIMIKVKTLISSYLYYNISSIKCIDGPYIRMWRREKKASVVPKSSDPHSLVGPRQLDQSSLLIERLLLHDGNQIESVSRQMSSEIAA